MQQILYLSIQGGFRIRFEISLLSAVGSLEAIYAQIRYKRKKYK